MCCRVPLPGTLVRMPSAFGEFLVSQTLTVAQNGLSSPASDRFECAEAVAKPPAAPWPAFTASLGFSATTTPEGSCGAASAPGGSRKPAEAVGAARRDAAQAIRTVGAASRGTTRGTSGQHGLHLSVGDSNS